MTAFGRRCPTLNAQCAVIDSPVFVKTDDGRSIISSGANRRQRPVVFCDARPENPDRNDREKSEQDFEKTSIYLA